MARRRRMGPKRQTTIAFDLNKMSHEIRMIILEEGNGIIGELAKRVAEEARSLAPTLPSSETPRGPNKRGGDHKSGPLKQNIFAQPSAKVPGSWLVVSPAWYSHLVEYGTEAHEIKPKNKKALAWVEPGATAGDDRLIITQHVNHPKVGPRPFLRPAADKAEQILDSILSSRRG